MVKVVFVSLLDTCGGGYNFLSTLDVIVDGCDTNTGDIFGSIAERVDYLGCGQIGVAMLNGGNTTKMFLQRTCLDFSCVLFCELLVLCIVHYSKLLSTASFTSFITDLIVVTSGYTIILSLICFTILANWHSE